MHSRPGFITKTPHHTVLEDFTTTELIQAVMPLTVLEESLVIPNNRQYIVYGSLEIPDGMDVQIHGDLVVL